MLYWMMGRTLFLLGYATTGLGHLRVTNALLEAAPARLQTSLYQDDGRAATAVHRVMSRSPYLRRVMEWMQDGVPEDIFTRLYRHSMKKSAESLLRGIGRKLEGYNSVKRVFFISTHFGLAHQFSFIRHRLSVQSRLVVVVTDDSPQHAWLVPGADLTVVPSFVTKKGLERYRGKMGWKRQKIMVNPYPVDIHFRRELTKFEMKEKLSQVTLPGKAPIRMIVPVSGAAVGMDYVYDISRALEGMSARHTVTMISKDTAYTRPYINKLSKYTSTRIYTSTDDREVVRLYDKAMTDRVHALELTKPSEQAFKALIEPTKIGGVMLLLTKPVGRQEYDNLKFLERHGLIPREAQQKMLWEMGSPEPLLDMASLWRGVRLPDDPVRAAEFIHWAIKVGVFKAMLGCHPGAQKDDPHPEELSPDGATRFWEGIAPLAKG